MNRNKLRGRICEKFGTQAAFAEAMGLASTTISAKLNGKTDWTRQEMENACLLLEIPVDEIASYFFT